MSNCCRSRPTGGCCARRGCAHCGTLPTHSLRRTGSRARGHPGAWRDQFAAGTWVVGPVEAGERTGLAGLLWPPTEAPHVEWVWVAASHRGRGMLRSLMEELAAAARSADARTLKLWVLKDNADALAAYRKLGFIETGEEQELRVAEADGKS